MQSTDKQSRKPGFWGDIRPVMVTGSALLVVMFVLFTVINPDYAGTVFNSAKDFIASNLSWYYIALFKTIELLDVGYVLTGIMATICTFMLLTYFVTSADSATLVICTLVAMGNNDPPAKLRIFWGVAIGAVAAVLLYSGGLQALKTASIVVALPFSVVLILATFGLCKSLYNEGKTIDDTEPFLINPSTTKPVE